MNDEEEFEIGEVDVTDPIYQLWINCEDSDHKLIDSHLVGEFQYLDDANAALDTVKKDIGEIFSNIGDDRVRTLVIELDLTVNDEFIENVERDVYEF